MFENIILGPLCLVSKEYGESFHLMGLLRDDWIPLCKITKGETFDNVQKAYPETKFDYIIASIGFIKAYHE